MHASIHALHFFFFFYPFTQGREFMPCVKGSLTACYFIALPCWLFLFSLKAAFLMENLIAMGKFNSYGRSCFSSSDVFLFCWAAFLSISLLASFSSSSDLAWFMCECLAFVHGYTFLHSWRGPMALVVWLLHGAKFLSNLPLVLNNMGHCILSTIS